MLWQIGLLASLACAITGSIPVSVCPTAHGTAAFFLFLLGIVYVIVFYFKITRSLLGCPSSVFADRSHLLAWQRGGLSLLIGVNLLALIIGKGHDSSSRVYAIILFRVGIVLNAMCESKGCVYYVIDLGPVLEFSIVGSLIIFINSFRYEIKGVIVTQSVTSHSIEV